MLTRMHLLAGALAAGATLAASAQTGGRPLSASLTGRAEVPGPGDADGRGTARLTINPGQTRLCYKLMVRNVATPTAAHIHLGTPRVAGAVVVTLKAPVNGSSSGCVALSRRLIDAIRKAPQRYYVNVHNAAFPNGAVRGQLAR